MIVAALRTLLSVLTGLLIAGSVFASGASATPARGSIKSVALTTADLTQVYGGAFRAFMAGVISNKDLASIEKTASPSSGPSMGIVGRVTGYESVWFREARTSTLSVVNNVSIYRDSSIPQASFGQFAHVIKSRKGVAVHLSPFRGVGDEALVLTIRSHGNTVLGIIFRRGSYLTEIMVGAPHGAVSLPNLAKLAATEDQRIQTHG